MVPSLQPPDRASSASGRAAAASSSGLNPPRRPDSPEASSRAETSSPKACCDPLLSRSAPGGTNSPPQAAGVRPLMGGAWVRGEARHDGPTSPTAQSMCSSDDEGAPGNQRLLPVADLPNAAAARTSGSLLAELQAENAALKKQLRGALLKGEAMQLALRRIAEAAAISAGDRARSSSDEMVLTGAVLTGAPPPSIETSQAPVAAPVRTSPVLQRLETDLRTSAIVERLEAEGQHLQAPNLSLYPST